MIEIHILLAEVEIGPFSEKQVRQYLADGLITLADPARQVGMSDWEPVEVVLARLPRPSSQRTASPVPPEASPVALDPPPFEPLAPAVEVQADLPEVLPPPAATSGLPLLNPAAPKGKNRPSKIVVQPILPLSPAPSGRKKEAPAKPSVLPLSSAAPLPTTTPEPALTAPPVTSVPSPVLPKRKAEVKPASISLPPQVLSDDSTPLPTSIPRSRRSPTQLGRNKPVMISVLALVALVIIVPICSYFFARTAPKSAGTLANPPGSLSTAPLTVEDIAKILNSNPKTADEFCQRGTARQTKGDADGAIADFNQALTLNPSNPALVDTYYGRGLARRAKSDWNGALEDFNQVLKLNPSHADAYSNRGFVKQTKGDFDGAIADYTQALLIDPKIAIAFYNRGLIKEQRGDIDGAILDYNRALDLDPNMAVAYSNRGNAKNAENNLDGAIADYTQALALDPKIPLAYCNRGFARQSKGDLDGALSDYTQALALNPKLAIAYYNRGLIEEQTGDLDNAIADSSRALELNPKDAQSYCNRGLARMGKGDLDGAMGDLKTFCTLAPRDNDADYARLYLWLIVSEKTPGGHADQDLADALLNDWNSSPEDLSTKVAQFLLGHLSENDLMSAAASPDPVTDQGLRCKAWYFAGMKRLLEGDKPAALADFRKAVGTEKKNFCEYVFAQARLQALDSDSAQ